MSTNTTTPTSQPLEPSVSEAPPPVPSAPPTTVFEDHDGASPPTSTDAPLVGRGDPIPVGTPAPGVCYITSPDGTGTSDELLPCDAASWAGQVEWTSSAGPAPTLPVTGDSSGAIGGGALVFVLTGFALLVASRRRHDPVA